jgi:hypothetical protein
VGKISPHAIRGETSIPLNWWDDQVSKLDRSQGRLTVRDGGGKEYEFLASNETLQDYKVGDPIKAKLREVPKCPEK